MSAPFRRPRLVRNCARGAGTHTPWLINWARSSYLLQQSARWLWVPAFAGTTSLLNSILEVDHPLHRTPRFLGDQGTDGDFLTQVDEAVQNLGQRNPLHVRA